MIGQSLTPLILGVKTEVVELALKTRLKLEVQPKQKDAPSGVMRRVEEMEESRVVVGQWDEEGNNTKERSSSLQKAV